jgi:hypothetical protein
MNTNDYNSQEQPSVIAIAKTDDELRAVELTEHNGTFEVLWTKSSTAGETNWQAFAAECGLSAEPTAKTRFADDGNKIVVIGFDSAGTAFYRFNMPAVEKKEIEAIVTLQAESRLPLPAEQMELAWRTDRTQNGQMDITMAASRKQNVQAFVDKVKSIQPTQILLDCEAVVNVWRTLFSKSKKDAVIINAAARNTQACLVEDGRLSNSVVLDMGIEDFAEGRTEEETETTERYVQDIRSVVDLFGRERKAKLPVIILSDGGEMYANLVSALKSAGISAQVSPPESAKLSARNKIGNKDIYKYRVPIGLALTALETDTDKLNLFENLYNPAGKEKRQHWLLSPKVVYTTAAVILALFIIVSYAVTIARPGAIEKHIKASGAEADINLIMERQKLKKVIAQQRPDLLEMLNEITICGQSNQRPQRSGRGQSSGIQLESFHFKKGQPVTITGQASNNDQLYSFEKSLEERTDIKEVKRSTTQNIISSNVNNNTRNSGNPRSGRNRGTKFTITFHYKNFTK